MIKDSFLENNSTLNNLYAFLHPVDFSTFKVPINA